GDDGFPSLCIHRRCCLRRYTGGSTTLFSDSPSNNRPKCHDGAMPSLMVRPERWPVPPDWVLRLTCRVCFDVTGYPSRLTPGYRAHRDLPGRGRSTPLVSAGLGPRCGSYTFVPASRLRTPP